MTSKTDRKTDRAAGASQGFQTGWTRLSGRYWSSNATSHFPGIQREVEYDSLDLCPQGCMGERRGTHRGPPQRLVSGSGLPQPLLYDTQELINTLEENIGGVL